MAIDANIILQGQTPNYVNALLGGFQAGSAIKNQPAVDEMFQEKLAMVKGQRKDQDVERERQIARMQLQDMALDAIKIRPLLESGDTLRANVLIAERIKKIQQRGGDPSDTMAFRDALNSGQLTPQQAIGELDSVLEGARQAGVLEGAGDTAGFREFQSKAAAAGLKPGTPEYQSAAMASLGVGSQSAGPEGKGVDAWAIRTLLSGDPSSPEYAAAYKHYGRPKTQYTQTDAGLIPVTSAPDMSAFRTPAGASAGQDFPGSSPPPPPPIPGGQPSPIPGTAKSPSVEQGNAAGFYARMVNSNKIIDDLEKKGYSPDVRDFVTAGGKWTSAATSEEGQMYRQAQENWVRANLRKESGAAIPEGEMEAEIKNYFPMPGDKPATIKQKAQNRRVVTDAMRMAAGPGAKAVDAQFTDKIASPKTQADYDALPSGAIFIDPDDGKQYRKP